jgi:hypothetical protein
MADSHHSHAANRNALRHFPSPQESAHQSVNRVIIATCSRFEHLNLLSPLNHKKYMTTHKIEPHRITKPIQLLAAWIIGLILTDSIFLYSAVSFEPGTWERGALVIASILNVPGFLFALFLLQTKFRAELQEDTFYHEYINKKTAIPQRIDKDVIQDSRIDELEKILKRSHSSISAQQQTPNPEQFDWDSWPVGINGLHPQYQEIRKALRAHSIPVSSIFGTEDDSSLPKKWVIALNPAIPFHQKIHLLRTLIPFNFDGFEFHIPVREADEDDDVYIGGYGFGDYCEFNDSLKDLVADDIEEVDFQHYYNRNRISNRLFAEST